jgi:hypothetical protein
MHTFRIALVECGYQVSDLVPSLLRRKTRDPRLWISLAGDVARGALPKLSEHGTRTEEVLGPRACPAEVKIAVKSTKPDRELRLSGLEGIGGTLCSIWRTNLEAPGDMKATR